MRDKNNMKLIDFIKLNNVQINDIVIEGSFFNTHYTILNITIDFITISYQASYGTRITIIESDKQLHWKLPKKTIVYSH